MASKWAALKDQLPKLPDALKFDGDGDFATKVGEVKTRLAGEDIKTLAALYNELCAVDDAIKAAQKEANVAFEALEALLVHRMEDQGLGSFKLHTGENFILTSEPYPNVKDKGACRQWFEDQGMREVLNVHPSTLKSIVKGLLENPIDPVTNEPRPMPEGVEIFMKTSVQRRKK